MSKPQTWSLWVYRRGIGWWLEDEGYDNIEDAAGAASESYGSKKGDKTQGSWAFAILPDGTGSKLLRKT